MRRPGLGTLTPGGSVDGFNYRVSFGNPNLDPTRATTYDLSFEWYFARESLLSVALFKKDFESFLISQTIIGSYASTDLPLSLIIPSSPAAANPEGQPWQIATTINGPGASIKGVEVGLQLPFTFLPSGLDGFGFTGNVTYVKSDTVYDLQGPATNPLRASFPDLTRTSRQERLLGLSTWSANGTLYYEKDKFSARGSLAYRSGYLDTTGGNGNLFDGFHGTIYLDASIGIRSPTRCKSGWKA
jgi:TonB-dependent receptor